MPVIVDLKARTPVNLGHRKLVHGEVFTRLQFRTDDDFKTFRTLLRWSSFEMAVVDPSTLPAATNHDDLRADLNQANARITAMAADLAKTKNDLSAASENLNKANAINAELRRAAGRRGKAA